MRTAALVVAITLFATAPARADTEAWADIEVMDDAEMSDLRGGIAIGPGLDVGFGAVVTTTVNGMPALQTTLTWSNTGAFVTETVGAAGQALNTLTPAQRDALGVGNLGGAGGVVIEDEQGVTALVHNVTEGSLQNIILNNASGRDLSQHVDVTLTLPGFDVMQSMLVLERFGMRVDQDMSAALAN
jgi:hypothetical protein